MRHFRKDPLSDRWVAYAQERDDRPNEYESDGHRRPGTRCPFCAGHEQDTPPEIVAYAAGSRSKVEGDRQWLIRVVPNKYPAFDPDGDAQVFQDGLYESSQATGAHEVIIESPRHVASVTQLSDEEVTLMLCSYRDRLLALRRDGRFRYALIFKNVGPQAGASVEHSHSQLVATPMVPSEIASEIAAAERLYLQHQGCFFCRVIADELAHRQRLVAQTDRFLAICPYASRWPYEMWVLPHQHAGHFPDQQDDALEELALLLREILGKLESLHGRLAYNYFIHTSPFSTSSPPHYHWHIEVLPRLTTTAGFEWGAGYYINPVLPEQAAAVLRSPGTGGHQKSTTFPSGKTS